MRLPGKGMSWKRFFKALKDELAKDNISDIAGSVTFFGILALFPSILFLVSLASVVIDPPQAEALVKQLSQVAPPQVTEIVGQRIRQLGASENVGLLGVGALGALWAASGGMMAIIRALNIAYDVKDQRPFWKVRGVAILMVLVTSVLAIVASLAAIATPAIAERIGGPIGTTLVWLRLPFAGLVMMFLWALLYYALPDVEQKFKFITPGSVIGVLLWLLASWGFSLYVNNFGNYDATYGSLGGIVVLLMWMWISAQALLIGAEVNTIIEHESPEGKREGAKSLADTGTSPQGTGREQGRAPPGAPERAGDGREVPAPHAPPGHLEVEGPALAAVRDASLHPDRPGTLVRDGERGHRRTVTALAGVAAGALVLRLRHRGETLH